MGDQLEVLFWVRGFRVSKAPPGSGVLIRGVSRVGCEFGAAGFWPWISGGLDAGRMVRMKVCVVWIRTGGRRLLGSDVRGWVGLVGYVFDSGLVGMRCRVGRDLDRG